MNDPLARIPLVDLHTQYLSLKGEIDAAIADVIANSAFIRGPNVERFERDFAAAIGVDNCISCGNGTDAIYIALVALGIEAGDEVIVPAMSWISTSETVTQAGGRVVFCDIHPETHTLDPDKLAEKITSKTVGIIPVHLYGHPANMPKIMEVAEAHGLWVLEDCAQAHLANFDGRKVGTYGAIATFSFYPGKNLGAMGDAGAIVTSDSDLARRAAMYARHGGLNKHDHQIEGINSRMDGLQAAILNVKLKQLKRWTKQRRAHARSYLSGLASLPVTLSKEAGSAHHVWHLFVILTPERDALRRHLSSAKISSSVNYPKALPMLACYSSLGLRRDDFPVAVKLQDECLALPMYPELTKSQIERVCNVVGSFFDT